MQLGPHRIWLVSAPGEDGSLLRHLQLRCQELGLAPAGVEAAARAMLEGCAGGWLLTGRGGDAEHPYLEVLGQGAGPALLAQLQVGCQHFEVHRLGQDAALVSCRFYAAGQGQPALMDAGGLCLALAGEAECGDAWECLARPDEVRILLVDGLGHGPGAAKAARAALEHFNQQAEEAPAACLRSMHQALRKTQGAVAAIAHVNPGLGRLTFAGVGNISGRIFDRAATLSCLSSPGVLGFRLDRLREESHPWTASSVLVLHTDGLRSLTEIKALPRCSASLTAASLYRRLDRGKDDCGVVVVREWRTSA